MTRYLTQTRRATIGLLAAALLIGCTLPPGMEPAPPAPLPTAPPAAETPAPGEQPTEAPVQPGLSTAAPALTPRPTVESRPASRTPINGRLLYVRNGNLYHLSGTNSTQLTNTRELAWARWSPDGTRIAAVRRGDAFAELHLLDAQGQNLAQLTKHQSKETLGSKEYIMASIWVVSPTWEPNGTRLVYSADVTAANMALWLVDSKGGAPQALQATADLGANIEGSAFSPDGKMLAFALANTEPSQIWTVDLTTGGKVQLTDGKHATYDPAWTPDGKALTVAILDGNSTIWLLGLDGKPRTQLVSKLSARAPTWSPDGTQLAFIGEEEGRFNVYLVDIRSDGSGGYVAGEPRRVTNDGNIDAVSGLSWTR